MRMSRYAYDAKVRQISAHMFALKSGFPKDALFLPITTSWGWATWDRAWCAQLRSKESALKMLSSLVRRYRFDLNGAYPFSRMLADQLQGKNDSWAIWWYLYVFSQNGVVLFPGQSLISNEGFDGSGTHCAPGAQPADILAERELIDLPSRVKVLPADLRKIRYHMIRQRGLLRFAFDNWARLKGVPKALQP